MEFEEVIELCKQAVIKACARYEGKEAKDRPWLEAHIDPYGSCEPHRVQLFVLEGTPVKGYVVADYGRKRVQAFDSVGRKLRGFDSDDLICDLIRKKS